MIIGSKVIFITEVWEPGDRGIKDRTENTGIVYDRFRDFVKEDNETFSVDFYLIVLENGVVAHCRPHHVIRVYEKRCQPVAQDEMMFIPDNNKK